MSIAAIVITKDEERNIAACLESLRWADEILVVDACSSDRTVEIARTFTNQVFVRPWPGFGPQKNFGMEQTRADWVLIVDADERVTEPLRQEIQSLVQAGPSPDVAGFEIPRRNFFYGRWIRGGGIYPDYQLRLFRRSAGRYDDVLLHERLQLRGRITRLQHPLDHYSMPGIREHVRKMVRYTTLGAQEKLKVRSRVTALDLAGNHLGTIVKTYMLRGGYRDGIHGIIVALFAGMHTFVKYAKAWEALHVKSEG
ncbi:MAG TPA: glycosyltransferase family 2 protein [Nitrospiraceae bacterium]|jgi:glycosyltransferase involved in cell wall biosynthesis|nr:glycosyltransferase family 2 protein [Nitrospiraceae bacterium]